MVTTRSRTAKTQRTLRSGRRINVRNTSGIRDKRALKAMYDRFCFTNLGPNWSHAAKASDPRLKQKYPMYRVSDCVRSKKPQPVVANVPLPPREFNLPANFPRNLTHANVTNYLRNYHMGLRSNRPLPSAPITAERNRCNDPKQLTATQSMMHSLAWAFARNRLDPNNKGLLGWHSTGSGKTCTAASVMHACWDTPRKIVYCTTVEGKRSNPPETFVDCFHQLFPTRPLSIEQLQRRVHFLSFAQMAHRLNLWKGSKGARGDLYDNAMIIVDEVQNLFKPIPGQEKEHEKLEEFLLDARNTRPNLKIVILTATPGTSVEEVYRLLNLVRDRREAPLRLEDNEETVRRKVRGIIQHYDSNLDLSRFPRVTYMPPQECVLSASHTREYYKKLAELVRCRTVACETTKLAALRKYMNAPFLRAPSSTDSEHSCKFDRVLNQVQAEPDQKHWIYSAFYENRGYGQGVTGLKKMLEARGYVELTPDEASHGAASLAPRPRFCIVTRPALKNKKALEALLSVYNHADNRHGALCQVMIASNKYNEGVDLKAVRHIHLVEPLVTQTMVDQAVGRARRLCSHSQLPNTKDWTVTVHEYFARPDAEVSGRVPKNIQNRKTFSIDREVYDRAREEHRPIQKLYQLLQSTSIDRGMFVNNNNQNRYFTPMTAPSWNV